VRPVEKRGFWARFLLVGAAVFLDITENHRLAALQKRAKRYDWGYTLGWIFRMHGLWL
jgi:hypothetical protein